MLLQHPGVEGRTKQNKATLPCSVVSKGHVGMEQAHKGCAGGTFQERRLVLAEGEVDRQKSLKQFEAVIFLQSWIWMGEPGPCLETEVA